MAVTPNYDLDIDSTLGGDNASDYVIPSQKAIKSYVDNNSVIPSNMVTTDTDQDITGVKTYVGQKRIGFKQSGSSDKLGFTLYNNNNVEKGYLEFNPSNNVDGAPLMTLGNYATAAAGITHVGFRKYSSVSGASGAYNLLAPLISNAKTPFNLTTTYTNFYLPLGFTDGTTMVTTANTGVVDLSSILPDISGKQDSSTAVTHTASTAVGSSTTPVYVASDGKATALSYTIEKSVPSNAVFTDTKNTAGSTQLASTKLYLIGASTQGDNPQTYSNSSFYITDTGKLNIPNPDASSNSTIAATTKWVMDKGYTTNTGTITGITMNGTSKGTSGIVDLGTVITSHQTIKQDGITGATVNRFGTCSTAAGTAGKEVSITTGTFSLEAGASVRVKFSNANTASSPTLKVGSTDAKNIFHKGSQITTGDNKALLAGVCDFVYDGTQYHLVGNYINTNTDTLMTQNVSSTDSTYPILACPTANATTNQGAKTGIFGASVKLNPSTGTVITNKVSVGAGVATMQYNSTTEAIEFVFT